MVINLDFFKVLRFILNIILPDSEYNSQPAKENICRSNKNLLEVPTIDITTDESKTEPFKSKLNLTGRRA